MVTEILLDGEKRLALVLPERTSVEEINWGRDAILSLLNLVLSDEGTRRDADFVDISRLLWVARYLEADSGFTWQEIEAKARVDI